MKYFAVIFFGIIVPALGRPQAPTQPQTQQTQGAQTGGQTTPISIISQTEVVGVDGSFNYSYELSDGVRVDQSGYLKQGAQGRSLNASNPDDNGDIQVIQGSYSYIAPDGQHIDLKYIADENGFQPEGSHLPTTPPAPEGVAHSLDQQQQAQPQLHQQYSQQQYSQQPQQQFSTQPQPQYSTQSQAQYSTQPQAQYSTQPQPNTTT